MPSTEPLQVMYFQTRDGRQPFREWINGLTDSLAYAALKARLARLRLGLFGDCKPVGEGVLELRIDVGPGYRIYAASTGGRVILLLCGGDKRSQTRDICRAKEYWRDYEKRIRSTFGSG